MGCRTIEVNTARMGLGEASYKGRVVLQFPLPSFFPHSVIEILRGTVITDHLHYSSTANAKHALPPSIIPLHFTRPPSLPMCSGHYAQDRRPGPSAALGLPTFSSPACSLLPAPLPTPVLLRLRARTTVLPRFPPCHPLLSPLLQARATDPSNVLWIPLLTCCPPFLPTMTRTASGWTRAMWKR